jgi:Fur family transcriptional regulator, ferric uptake regulator
MNDSPVLSALKAKGRRITTARAAIVEYFVASRGPFSAANIFGVLKKQKLRTDLATVYRELAFLLGEGILREVQFNDGVRRYEILSDDHHHHLVCTSCHSIQDVHMDQDLDAVEKLIEKETSFKVQSHTLEFYGLCSQCA